MISLSRRSIHQPQPFTPLAITTTRNNGQTELPLHVLPDLVTQYHIRTEETQETSMLTRSLSHDYPRVRLLFLIERIHLLTAPSPRHV